MTEPESMTQARGGQETRRGKGGKGKTVIKKSKGEASSRQQKDSVENPPTAVRQPEPGASGSKEAGGPCGTPS